MDNPESPRGGARPPRKELIQGPRPTPLKVRKDSHKIKKPPMAPPAAGPPQNNQPPPQQPPPRQPVIIYTVSPKVIHTHPSGFMNLVQRLTGPDHATSSYSTTRNPSCGTSSHVSGAISPAARLASLEMTKMHPGPNKKYGGSTHQYIDDVGQITSDGGGGGDGGRDGVGRTTFFPAGILSPGPGSLPPISPNLFTPIFHEPNSNNINVQHENRNYIEGNYLPSPFFASPGTMISPSSLDFLQRVLNS